jgi:hypothetical protein
MLTSLQANATRSAFAENIDRHIHRALYADPFHVSANTDPKGDRSKSPQEQDPDSLLHMVKEPGQLCRRGRPNCSLLKSLNYLRAEVLTQPHLLPSTAE